MSRNRKSRSQAALATMLVAVAAVVGSPAAHAASAPTFHLPFPCDEVWQVRTYSGHSPSENALDMKHSSGTSLGRDVIASAPGTATTVVDVYGTNGGTGYGNYVLIDHGGGWSTRYAHLDTVAIAQGDPVRVGTKIGTVGHTGNTVPSDFAHVHYEQRLNGTVKVADFDGTAWSKTYDWRSATSTNCKMWNAAGHLADATVYSRDLLGSGAAHIDFNGDKRSDTFRATGSDFKVRYGGSGSWQTLRADSPQALEDLAFGDFNGDGKTDVFQANGSVFRVRYGGSTAWQTLSDSTAKMRKLAFGDFNGDGTTDVLRTRDGDWDVRYGGTGSWKKLSSSIYEIHELAFADFNGDGKTDAFRTTGSEWKIRWGSTGSWSTLNTGSQSLRELAFSDFSGDDKTDVLRANGSKWRIRSGGTGAWQDQTSSVELHKLALGDFDGNSKGDVLRATGADRWEVRYAATGSWKDLSGSTFKVNEFISG